MGGSCVKRYWSPSTRKVAQCWAGNIAPVPVTTGRHADKPGPCDGSAYVQAGVVRWAGRTLDIGETSNVGQCLRRFGSVSKARAGTVTTKTRRTHAGNITKTRTQTIPRPVRPPRSQWCRTRCRSPGHEGPIPGPPSQMTTTRRRKREGKGRVWNRNAELYDRHTGPGTHPQKCKPEGADIKSSLTQGQLSRHIIGEACRCAGHVSE